MTDTSSAKRPDRGRLWVEAWPDPVLDELGHDPRSLYVERFWLPMMGPSSVFLLRRLAVLLEQSPGGFDLDILECSREIGLGRGVGKASPIWRVIERTERFRALRLHGDRLLVRNRLDSLAGRQADRLPPALRDAHQQWLASQVRREHRVAG